VARTASSAVLRQLRLSAHSEHRQTIAAGSVTSTSPCLADEIPRAHGVIANKATARQMDHHRNPTDPVNAGFQEETCIDIGEPAPPSSATRVRGSLPKAKEVLRDGPRPTLFDAKGAHLHRADGPTPPRVMSTGLLPARAAGGACWSLAHIRGPEGTTSGNSGPPTAVQFASPGPSSRPATLGDPSPDVGSARSAASPPTTRRPRCERRICKCLWGPRDRPGLPE